MDVPTRFVWEKNMVVVEFCYIGSTFDFVIVLGFVMLNNGLCPGIC